MNDPKESQSYIGIILNGSPLIKCTSLKAPVGDPKRNAIVAAPSYAYGNALQESA